MLQKWIKSEYSLFLEHFHEMEMESLNHKKVNPRSITISSRSKIRGTAHASEYYSKRFSLLAHTQQATINLSA